MFELVLALIVLLLGVAFFFALRSKGRKSLAAGALVIGLVLCLALTGLASIVTVPTGHTGVVTTFGRVENYTLDSGVHPKLPWQNVVKLDNRVQKDTADLSCFSSDIQEVALIYTINYQIKKSDAMTIYRTIGTDYYNTVILPCVTESVKVVTARYTAEQLVSCRDELASAIEADLTDKLLMYNIEVVSTSIENMDFTDAFTDAVEAKQVAQQNKLRAETEAEQKVIEAYELLTKAEAEAEANRKLAESLTQGLIDYTYAQAWNGELPEVMTSDGGSMVPVLDVNKLITNNDGQQE